MSSDWPVIAAVPNYNMAAELEQLLPQLLRQGYAAIYVLDDASTDDSKTVVTRFAPTVSFIAGDTNIGAGGNRNRILQVLPENKEVLIHFIDADTRLETSNTADIIRGVVPNEPFAFLCGLAKDMDGTQNVWNFGPRPSLYNEWGAWCQHRYGQLLRFSAIKAKRFHSRHRYTINAWPDPTQKPVARKVFWGIEQNIVFRSDVFRQYGGFDPSIRETEIIELALRMHKDNLTGHFNPAFSVRHTEARVREYNRGLRKRLESIRLIYKYGVLRWLIAK